MPNPPRLLPVSDRRLLAGASFAAWAAELATLGVDALLVRERDLDDHLLHELLSEARRALPRPARLLVHRRVDLAGLADADGVHLPADGLPVARIRAVAPDGFLIGRSTHTAEEVASARHEGADYVVFGPLFETPSKAGILPPRGLAELARVSALGIPVVAIGGIDEQSAPRVLAAGAVGIAAIRAFADPVRARRLIAATLGAAA
jgi:thiamine-phosphate pyrophosphorylase